MTKQRRTMSPTLEDAREFVVEVSECDSDTNILYSRVVIDAKSVLGVLSLDLTRMLIVECNENNKDLGAYFSTKVAGKIAAA